MKTLILLAALFGLQDEPNIQDWIDRLDAPELDKREEAAEKLLALGEKALAPLHAFLEKPSSKEAGARAKDILGKIEWKVLLDSLEGGNVVGGFRMKLIPTRKIYEAGKPVTFIIEVKNVGKKAGDFIMLQHFNHQGVRSNSTVTSAHGSLKLVSLDPVKDRIMGGKIGCGIAPPRTCVRLKPGETWKTEVRVTDYEKPLKGRYELTATYFARSQKFIPGAKEDLRSNTYRFEVK